MNNLSRTFKILVIYLAGLIVLFAIYDTADCQQVDVYVDAGHGGPSASQTNNGGGYNGYNGAVGQDSTAEQWINLQVALKLRDTAWLYNRYTITNGRV